MRRNYFKRIDKFILLKEDIRVVSLFFIIFQSLGIRFFGGQGWAISLFLLLLNLDAGILIKKRDFIILCSLFFFFLFNWLINQSSALDSFFYQYSLILNTYLILLKYRESFFEIEKDFYVCTKVFIIHALCSSLLYYLIPSVFTIKIGLNQSFLGLFYVSSSDFAGIVRSTGLFWEPGVYQIIANLFLFFTIKLKQSNFKILIAIGAVIISFSSMGFAVLLLNALYYFSINAKMRVRNVVLFFLGFIFIIALSPLLLSNILNKVSGDNTSGIARLRDIMVGIELIKERPILGHGKFDSKEYLLKKNYVLDIEAELFSPEYIEISGSVSGGLTNGVLALLAWYGLPLGLILYYYYFKQKIVSGRGYEKFLFAFIPFLSFMSEPLTFTAFFLLFPFSALIFKSKIKLS